MIKTFELIYKALIILLFWSIILICVYFTKIDYDTHWLSTIMEYVTALLACIVMFMACLALFYMFYRNDDKKIKSKFSKTYIDGFECNIGYPFRLTPAPKTITKCEALDLHSVYFKAGVLSQEINHKEQQELKNISDNLKIADLISEKMVLIADFKNIQALLVNLQYSKSEVDRLSTLSSLSEHQKIEFANYKANIEASDENEIKEKITKIKEGLNELDEKIKIIGQDNTNRVQDVEDIANEEADPLLAKNNGNIMYGNETVNFNLYVEHNKKGLLYYRTAFESMYSLLSENKRVIVDTHIANLMEALPNFNYVGVVSSTPKVKKLDGFELALDSYQLTIFTALFPVFTWLDFRESQCLENLDLHDKRMLWNAKRLYDIFVKRDEDLKANRPSSYSIPLKTYQGSYRLAHEELGCLVELWRFVENAELIEAKVYDPITTTSNITNHDLIQIVRDLITQEDRLNGANRDKRIGFWYDAKIYLDWKKFIVEAKIMFVSYHISEAHKVNDLDAMIFNALKAEDCLAMEIKDKLNYLDKGVVYDQGQLFDVTWESVTGTDSEKEKISYGTLVLKVRPAFRRVPQTAKKGSNSPSKLVVSDHVIEGTPFAKNNGNKLKEHHKLKQQIKISTELTTKATHEADAELDKLTKLEKLTNSNQLLGTTKDLNTENQKDKNQSSIDAFFGYLEQNKSAIEAKAVQAQVIDDNHNQNFIGANSKTVDPKATHSPSQKPLDAKTKSKKSKKAKTHKHNPFLTNPIVLPPIQIPTDQQGMLYEVSGEDNQTYVFAEDIQQHLKQVDCTSLRDRNFLTNIHLDRLRFMILQKEITVKSTHEDHWFLGREDILKYIPLDIQSSLLAQPVVENLYKVIPLNKNGIKDDDLAKQQMHLQKIINEPIKSIRSFKLLRISRPPEHHVYHSNIEKMSFSPKELNQFIVQLERCCFDLNKQWNNSIRFNPTPTSHEFYGIYRILMTELDVLGDLAAQFKHYCAYKFQKGHMHHDDEIKKNFDLIHCIYTQKTEKSVYVFFAPMHANDRYLQEVPSISHQLIPSTINKVSTNELEVISDEIIEHQPSLLFDEDPNDLPGDTIVCPDLDNIPDANKGK